MVKEEKKEDDKKGIGALHDFLGGHSQITKHKEKDEVVRPLRKFDMTNRFHSGVPGLDNLISGGFKIGSHQLIMGGPGTGKTLFAIQFLMQDIDQFETVVYFSFEEKKDKLYDEMKQFGWNLSDYEVQKKFYYLNYTPSQIEALLSEGGGTLDQFMSKIKPTRLVIDSITSFTLLGGDDIQKRENILAFLNLITKWGCTTLFTSQHTMGGRVEDESSSFIEYEVDGIILLYFVRKGMLGEGRERKLEILKMRGTAHQKGAVIFEIGENGVVVGS